MPLYIISTPIGNLDDLTLRAKKKLSEMEIILAEDTRKTGRLLSHFDISGPSLIFYDEHNQQQLNPKVINWLKQNKKIGLVSNAGTPLISDPGYNLVKQVIKLGMELIPIPGPTALITALVVSGFPPTRFSFLGFLPKSSSKKSKIFKELKKSKNLIPTIIFYESPNRLKKTLKIIEKELGNVSIVVCRELTKKFEEKIRGTTAEVIDNLNSREEIKGEVTVLIKLE